MQSLPSVSADIMPAGPSANTSSAKAGQAGNFADHLTVVSKKQAPPRQVKEASSRQERTSPPTHAPATDDAAKTSVPARQTPTADDEAKITSSTGQPPAPDDEATTSPVGQTPTAGGGKIKPSPAGRVSAADDKADKSDPANNLTLNGSAGAATAWIVPVALTIADGGSMPIKTASQPQKESAVSQILTAITRIADDGAVAAAQQKSDLTAQTEQQSGTLAGKQSVLPTNPPVLENAGTPPAHGTISTGENTGQIAHPTPLPQISVSFVADTALTAEASNKTGQLLADPATVLPNAAQPDTNQVVQNQYGQIITIHQASDPDTMVNAMEGAGKTATTKTQNPMMDANANSIHSHLPNDASKTTAKEGESQQQDPAKDNRQQEANPAKFFTAEHSHTDQLSSQDTVIAGKNNQSLTFSPTQISTPLAGSTTSSSTTPLSTLMQLPSGLTVPGETVVDQMIAHFSVNKQLESGTVNLKLHPQELGELRMEIRVAQDNIKAHIIAQNPQAQEMIDRHMPRLREALEQQGLHLQQVEVTVAANDNTDGGWYRENAQQQHLNHSMQNKGSQPVFALDTEEETGEAAQGVNNLSVLA